MTAKSGKISEATQKALTDFATKANAEMLEITQAAQSKNAQIHRRVQEFQEQVLQRIGFDKATHILRVQGYAWVVIERATGKPVV